MKTPYDTATGAPDPDHDLRHGLGTQPLDSDALNRIRRATEAEWRSTLVVPNRRLWKRSVAVAAGIAIASMAGALLSVMRLTGSGGEPLGTIERIDHPGGVVMLPWRENRSLYNGDNLRAGQNILMRGSARVLLPGAGSLRLAAGTRLEVVSAHALRLQAGSLYLDVAPEHGSELSLAIETPAGTFSHVGTQFQIALQNDQTLLQVREGQVRWQSGVNDRIIEAGNSLRIDSLGRVFPDQVAITGPNWGWAEGLAKPLPIDGESLADVLQHIARETGRRLVYANLAVENRAHSTILHGSIDAATPSDTLSKVMETTSLHYELRPGSILIESSVDSRSATP